MDIRLSLFLSQFYQYKKIFRLIYFQSKHESVSKAFADMKIVTVHELYVLELMKFWCKSLNYLSTTAFFKTFHELNSGQNVLEVLDCSLLQFHGSDQCSILFRSSTEAVKFFLSRKSLLPKVFGSREDGEVTDFVHTFHILLYFQT